MRSPMPRSAAICRAVSGSKSRRRTVSTCPGAAADERANMQVYFVAAEQDIVGLIDPGLLRELNPGLQSFDTWLSEHKSELSLRS